jgi:malate/lactate dehydrogenase
VPAVVNRAGVQRLLPVPLSDQERHGLHQSARAVRSAIDKLGIDVASAPGQGGPDGPDSGRP